MNGSLEVMMYDFHQAGWVKIMSLFFPLSCLCRLIFGTLYPAYYSYKAVKSKDIKEYVSEASHCGWVAQCGWWRNTSLSLGLWQEGTYHPSHVTSQKSCPHPKLSPVQTLSIKVRKAEKCEGKLNLGVGARCHSDFISLPSSLTRGTADHRPPFAPRDGTRV